MNTYFSLELPNDAKVFIMKSPLIIIATTLSAGLLLGSADATFSLHFFESYREGRCHENVVSFVKQLRDQGQDLEGFSLMKLENKGTSSFGLINAEKARSVVNGQRIAEEKNWYEHWIAVDSNGIVFDFDFTTSPHPLAFQTYVEEMFLIEEECETPSWTELCGGHDSKLDEYRVTIFSASKLLEGDKTAVWSGSLREALSRAPGE